MVFIGRDGYCIINGEKMMLLWIVLEEMCDSNFKHLGIGIVSMLGSMQGNSYGEKERWIKQLGEKFGEQWTFFEFWGVNNWGWKLRSILYSEKAMNR